jgi:hypothetical protein
MPPCAGTDKTPVSFPAFVAPPLVPNSFSLNSLPTSDPNFQA